MFVRRQGFALFATGRPAAAARRAREGRRASVIALHSRTPRPSRAALLRRALSPTPMARRWSRWIQRPSLPEVLQTVRLWVVVGRRRLAAPAEARQREARDLPRHDDVTKPSRKRSCRRAERSRSLAVTATCGRAAQSRARARGAARGVARRARTSKCGTCKLSAPGIFCGRTPPSDAISHTNSFSVSVALSCSLSIALHLSQSPSLNLSLNLSLTLS